MSDGWRKGRTPHAEDYEVYEVLEIDGRSRATIECFTTHRVFYANAIDKDDHPHRRVTDEYVPAKAWCEQTTGFARPQ